MNPASGMFWSSTALAFGLGLAMKATVILAVVLLVQTLLASRRPLLGSASGHAGLVGLLLLPLFAAVFPSMPIACLPSRVMASRIDPVSPSQLSPAIALPGESDDLAPRPLTSRQHMLGSESLVVPIGEAGGAFSGPLAQQPVAPPPSAASPLSADIPRPWKTDWAAIAVAVYAIGVLSLFARLGASIWAVATLRRSGVNLCDPEWTSALDHWRKRLGIGRHVTLAASSLVSVPVVLGWLRPTIVVPGSLAAASPQGHADAVLLHEVCHVRRNDFLWNLVLRIAQALYWPHVLVWLLGRTLSSLRERACDDLCVHEMGGASAYRDILLAVAAGMVRRPGPALGLAMARPSRLGRRLAQIDQSRGSDRCDLPGPARIAIATLAIVIAGVTGAAQLVRAEDPQKATTAPAAAMTSSGPRIFHLRVVAAETGQPVPDADVRVFIAMASDWRKTDAQGRLDITYSTGPSDQSFSVDVWGKGCAMQRHNWGYDPNRPIPEGETVTLQPGETLGGIVRDEAGRPIAGATVYLWSHNYHRKDPHELLFDLRAVTGADGRWQTSGAPQTTGELLGIRLIHPEFLSSRGYDNKEIVPRIADLRSGKAVTMLKKGVPIEGRVVDADGKPAAGARVLSTDFPGNMPSQVDEFAVFTDGHGHFRTAQAKPGQWHLIAQAKGHAPGVVVVKIDTAIPQVEIRLGHPHVFKGRVVDPQGKPIAGAFVNIDRWREYRCLGVFLWTDFDGRFRWNDAPGEDLTVNVQTPGYGHVIGTPVTPTGEEPVFKLEPALSIQGKVLDAKTRKRIDDATVELSAVDRKSGDPLRWTSLPRQGPSIGVFQGSLQVEFPVTASAYKIRVLAAGYHPFVSRTFRRGEKAVLDYDIALEPGTPKPVGAVATVLRPDGKPLAGARVVEMQYAGTLPLEEGIPNVWQGRKCREYRTSAEGTFAIPQDEQPWSIFILGEDSFVIVGKQELSKSTTIQAKPLARIEGQYLIGDQPVPNRELDLNGGIGDSPSATSIFISQKTTTDGEGRFRFSHVIPAPSLRIAPRDSANRARGIWTLGEPVRVEPGKTTQFTLGGKGRPVIGRVEPPAGWTEPIDFTDRSEARIDTCRPLTPYPASLFRGLTMKDGNVWVDWEKRWRQTAEGRNYEDRRISVGVPLAPDGSFRFDDVIPGDYRLSIRVNGETTYHVALMRRRPGGPFSHIVRPFTVPPVPGGRSDEPLDLGVLRLQPRVILEIGQPAPTFEITTTEGKRLVVPGDFQGKVLLINFGTLWDTIAPTTIAYLNEVHQKFGQDPRFAMLSLTCEPDTAGGRKSIADKGQPWAQAIVGPLSNPIASAYGIDNENASATVLIGPDGKIIAGELFQEKLDPAVAKALGRNPQ